jgi:hypothetical protein
VVSSFIVNEGGRECRREGMQEERKAKEKPKGPRGTPFEAQGKQARGAPREKEKRKPKMAA